MRKIIFIFLVIYFSTIIANAQWFQQTSNTYHDLRSIKFLDPNNGITIGLEGHITLKTSNGGNNWLQYANPFQEYLVNCLIMCDVNTGFAGGGPLLCKTTNGGVNWIENYNVDNCNIEDGFFINSQTGWICGDSNYYFYPNYYEFGMIRKTTNGGNNWFTQYKQSIPRMITSIFFVDSNTGYCVGNMYTILKTTNGGMNWILKTSSEARPSNCIYFINSSIGWICGGSDTVVKKTTDNGETWFTQLTLQPPWTLQSVFFVNENTGWTVGQHHSIFKTTNGGNNWLQQSNPIVSESHFFSVNFINSYTGWICGEGGIILKTTNGGITFVNNISSDVPKEYKLSQNYPNPFNPVTKIRFEFPLSKGGLKGVVSLKFFDILGKEIQTLVNEQLQPGTYEVTFDGSNLSSGIYFYQLKAEKFQEIRKMVLLK